MGNILFDFSFHPFPCNLIEGIMGDIWEIYGSIWVPQKAASLCFCIDLKPCENT